MNVDQNFFNRVQWLEFLLQLLTLVGVDEDVTNRNLYEELQKQNNNYLEKIIKQNEEILKRLAN